MIPDSERGPRYPQTRYSILEAARSRDAGVRARALDDLAAAYWRPVYAYVRWRWSRSIEDAEDLTQAFFLRFVERDLPERYDPGRARFRTFLRICLDGFAANERKAEGRLKRGGGRRIVSLPHDDIDLEVEAGFAIAPDPDEFLLGEWMRELLGGAVEELRAECQASERELHFALFRDFDLAEVEGRDRPTYQDLAGRHAIAVTQVTNSLHAVRGRFRRIVTERLRRFAASEAEFREDLRAVLGTDDTPKAERP